ncbi:unnamed protein product [Adineta ricciae]|uniref:Uncharacterized protein n=1 Tax=Adineta ricciae TaxID=249248 RepID=A0A814NAK1_ADIRI|nr:unnamed protein product [Adineta ricciae]
MLTIILIGLIVLITNQFNGTLSSDNLFQRRKLSENKSLNQSQVHNLVLDVHNGFTQSDSQEKKDADIVVSMKSNK